MTLPRCYQPPSDPPQKKTQNIWGGGGGVTKACNCSAAFPAAHISGIKHVLAAREGSGTEGLYFSSSPQSRCVSPPP